MLVKYTYPVISSLFFTEHWPVTFGPFKVEWVVNEGRVEAISVVVRCSAESAGLAKVTHNPKPGVAAEIKIGDPPLQEEADQILRTLRGILGFFSRIEIEFEKPRIDWIAETDAERDLIELPYISRSSEGVDMTRPIKRTYEFVARAILSAEAAEHFEIPLSFIRKADTDAHAGRHIDALYSVFFFLETLFAPGYSNPAKVKEKFRGAKPIRDGIAEARRNLSRDERLSKPHLKALLAKSDDELIDHIVDLRGRLHHHALPRKTDTWHPDKHRHFEADAWFWRNVIQKIAMDRIMPILFDPKLGMNALRIAEEAGAVHVIGVQAFGRGQDGMVSLRPVRFKFPGHQISHESLKAADEQFRKMVFELFPGIEIVEYRMVSADGAQVYAHYRRIQPE